MDIIILIIVIFVFLGYFGYVTYPRNPFGWPKIIYDIDISKRRQPSYTECIEEWLIENQDIDLETLSRTTITDWKNKSKKMMRKSWFWRNKKREIYRQQKKQIFDENYKLFEFRFFRNQTRYSQCNYKKQSYLVKNHEASIAMSYHEISQVEQKLQEINYETTLKKYFCKNQRSLMTKKLRREIIERDDFTCQICGKFMPDEVGLHIDHIVPISKGGKTVESNLQVLCDKCNLRKRTAVI